MTHFGCLFIVSGTFTHDAWWLDNIPFISTVHLRIERLRQQIMIELSCLTSDKRINEKDKK